MACEECFGRGWGLFKDRSGSAYFNGLWYSGACQGCRGKGVVDGPTTHTPQVRRHE